MSIVASLLQLIDPTEARSQRLEQERRRQPDQEDDDGDDPPWVGVKAEADRAAVKPVAPRYRCRLCAHESTDPEFCPRCLAGTMVERR